MAMAHVATWADTAIAVAAGIDALVHAPGDGPVDDAVVDAMASNNVAVVTTLTVSSAGSCAHESRDFLDHGHVEPYLDGSQRDEIELPGWGQCYEDWLPAASTNVKALHDAGVPILAGTDLANPGTISGVSTLHEMQLLAAAGLPAQAALVAATSAPADLLGLTDRGRIAPGLRADLVLMNATSVDDVVGTYDITAIWKNGYSVDREPT
jgi:imidazolonepropionase-like amidohydrolase